MLFSGDTVLAQILLADLLGHAGRIWDHFAVWAGSHPNGEAILRRCKGMSEKLGAWKSSDPLASLPPPP